MGHECDTATHTHRKLVVGKQRRHQEKKVLVVFAQLDRQDGKLAQERFDRRGEFPFVGPVFYSGAWVRQSRREKTITDLYL